MIKIKFSILVFLMLVIQSVSVPIFAQYKPVTSTYESIRVNSIYAGESDSNIVNFINPYKLIIQKEMNVLIATSEFPIEAEKPEGALNNLVADAVFEIGKLKYKNSASGPIDFCLLNYGGLRKGLPKGDIMIGNVFELMPFDNKLSVITLKGEQVIELFDFLVKKNEGHPIANCKIIIENGIASHISIGNALIDTNKTYKVVTSDYLSTGNDGMYFFKKAVKIEEVDFLLRDAIIEYLKKNASKPLRIEKDGRYIIKN